MIGVVIGTYSSIYVASPIVVIWKQFVDRRKPAVVPLTAGKAAAASPAGPKPAAPAIPPAPKKKSGRR